MSICEDASVLKIDQCKCDLYFSQNETLLFTLLKITNQMLWHQFIKRWNLKLQISTDKSLRKMKHCLTNQRDLFHFCWWFNSSNNWIKTFPSITPWRIQFKLHSQNPVSPAYGLTCGRRQYCHNKFFCHTLITELRL